MGTQLTISHSADYSSSFNRYIFDAVPLGSECLDIGCWTGNLGKLLIEKKNCIVDGLDFKSDVLESAQKNGYRKTFLINLNSEHCDLTVINKKYQVVIFADVLEHLLHPVMVLSHLKDYITPHGKVIISLPNVAFILNRIQLLLGHWNYKDYGILDKTHLRFYTIQSAVKMVESSGLRIEEVKPYNQFGVLRYIKPLDTLFPTLLAYQMLIVATP